MTETESMTIEQFRQYQVTGKLPKQNEAFREATRRAAGKVKETIGNEKKVEPHLPQTPQTLFYFKVNPIGKPRMTQSDKWKHRKCVDKYYQYKDELLRQAKENGFKKFPEMVFIIAYIEMPKSWSAKKKEQLEDSPHQAKPDADNIMKGIKDVFCDNDSYVWDERIRKLWAYEGSIIIFDKTKEANKYKNYGIKCNQS